jgi:hypothetical protein
MKTDKCLGREYMDNQLMKVHERTQSWMVRRSAVHLCLLQHMDPVEDTTHDNVCLIVKTIS